MTAFEVPHARARRRAHAPPASREPRLRVKYSRAHARRCSPRSWWATRRGRPETGRAGAASSGRSAPAPGSAALVAASPCRCSRRSAPTTRGAAASRSVARCADVGRNRDARLLLFVFFVESLGLGGLTVLVPFVTQYVMHRADLTAGDAPRLRARGRASASRSGCGSRARFEKRRLWLIAMREGGVGFGMLLGLGRDDWPLMVVSSLIAGTAQACAVTRSARRSRRT